MLSRSTKARPSSSRQKSWRYCCLKYNLCTLKWFSVFWLFSFTFFQEPSSDLSGSESFGKDDDDDDDFVDSNVSSSEDEDEEEDSDFEMASEEEEEEGEAISKSKKKKKKKSEEEEEEEDEEEKGSFDFNGITIETKGNYSKWDLLLFFCYDVF